MEGQRIVIVRESPSYLSEPSPGYRPLRDSTRIRMILGSLVGIHPSTGMQLVERLGVHHTGSLCSIHGTGTRVVEPGLCPIFPLGLSQNFDGRTHFDLRFWVRAILDDCSNGKPSGVDTSTVVGSYRRTRYHGSWCFHACSQ